MNKPQKVILCLLVVSILTSCIPMKSEWDAVAKGDYFIGFDSYDNGLWAIDRTSHKIIFLEEIGGKFEKTREVKTPVAPFEVFNLCVSRADVWVSFTDPRLSSFVEIWKLNKDDLTWEQEYFPENDYVMLCKTLRDDNVYFYTENGDLIKFQDNTSTRIVTEAKGIILDIAMDSENLLWILTSDNGGSIYRQREGNHWELWNQYPSGSIYILNSDALWLSSGAPYEASEWNIEVAQNPKNTYFPAINMPVEFMFSDNDGNTWLVTYESLWVRPKDTDDFQQKVKLPKAVYHIAINMDKSRIFVATDKAIYSFNLSSQLETITP